MKSKLFLFLVIVLASACHKREYPPDKVQLEPEDIFVSGSIGSEVLVLKTGQDGYYCYSSNKQNQDSIYFFTGELKKFDCNPCTQALRIDLSDYRKRLPGAAVVPDSSLGTGRRNLIPEMPVISTLLFNCISNKPVASVHWKTSEGDGNSLSNFTHEFAQQGVQTVSLTVKTLSGCESMIVNKIVVGGETGIFACSIAASTSPANGAQFTAGIAGGNAPYKYLWNFGDGSVSTASFSAHSYQYAGSYPVTLIVEDANGKKSESNLVFVAGNDLSSCALNMSVSLISSRNAQLNGALIQWTDANNVVFRSDKIVQPNDSYFEIIKSENYEANEKGEPGRLLTLRYNVLLSDGNRQLRFKSDNAAIAVSYK